MSHSYRERMLWILWILVDQHIIFLWGAKLVIVHLLVPISVCLLACILLSIALFKRFRGVIFTVEEPKVVVGPSDR